jgi:2-octaprenyl-6-methoxyphenol hydroxylase
MKRKQKTDLLIVGAGPIGLCMALELAKSMINITVIDQCEPQTFLKAGYDGRTTAIAYGSLSSFEDIGIWKTLLPQAEPIHDIYVTTEKQHGFVHYRSQDVGDHPFGYIVENRQLRQQLFSVLSTYKNVSIYAPSTLETIQFDDHMVQAHLSDEIHLQAPLCIAADGKKSALRAYANISATELSYDQTALVFAIKHSRPHRGRAFEHFLSTGPLAFLPMAGQKSSVVWSLKNDLASRFQNLTASEFADEVQMRFGDALGVLTLEGKIWSYPLSAMVTHNYIGKRLALIGDAAHTIHPVAGQGFNLGLRDVKTLSSLLTETLKLGLDIGSAQILKQYQRQRRLDTHTMTAMTDSLVRLFSNDIQTLSRLNGLGLSITNKLPLIKRLLTRHAMGLPLFKSS